MFNLLQLSFWFVTFGRVLASPLCSNDTNQDLPETLTIEHFTVDYKLPGSDVGERCHTWTDCENIDEYAYCNETGICVCLTEPVGPDGKCPQRAPSLGDPCIYEWQCILCHIFSTCGTDRVCTCKYGNVSSNGKCPTSPPPTQSPVPHDTPVPPSSFTKYFVACAGGAALIFGACLYYKTKKQRPRSPSQTPIVTGDTSEPDTPPAYVSSVPSVISQSNNPPSYEEAAMISASRRVMSYNSTSPTESISSIPKPSTRSLEGRYIVGSIQDVSRNHP